MSFKCPICDKKMSVINTRSFPTKVCRVHQCSDCEILRGSTEMFDTKLAETIAVVTAKVAPPENRFAAYDAAIAVAAIVNPSGRDTDIRHAAMQVLNPPAT